MLRYADKLRGSNLRQKLTSFWDFHTTLRDILHLSRTGNWQELEEPRHSLEIEKKMRKYSKRGMSLLRSLPVGHINLDHGQEI